MVVHRVAVTRITFARVQIAGVIAPYRQVAVTANLSEPISEVDVVEGQQVRSGQVLARQLTDDSAAERYADVGGYLGADHDR